MGAPDPDGVDIDFDGDRAVVQYQVWREANPKSRKARAIRILRMVGHDGEGWRCRWCEDYIPIFKRTDARYCSTRCRKAGARARRKARKEAATIDPTLGFRSEFHK